MNSHQTPEPVDDRVLCWFCDMPLDDNGAHCYITHKPPARLSPTADRAGAQERVTASLEWPEIIDVLPRQERPTLTEFQEMLIEQIAVALGIPKELLLESKFTKFPKLGHIDPCKDHG